MPKVVDLGLDAEGYPQQGIEVEFETLKETWLEYLVPKPAEDEGPIKIRVKHTATKIYVLTDEEGKMLYFPDGAPEFYIVMDVSVTKRSVEDPEE